jgi:hypothetical protein
VLKLRFSFVGLGIDLYPTKEKIAGITDKENGILQEKVTYASVIKTKSKKTPKAKYASFISRERITIVKNRQ